MGTRRPVALTIAGSDSGGGAGIQADLKTFAAFECFGTSAVVAVTVQNTLGVRAVHPVPAGIVSGQLEALADDLPPDACKTGMLATRELVLLVAGAIERFGWSRYVLDPVMVASSGDALLAPDAIDAIRTALIPLTACVTPNLDEAELLVGFPVRDPDAMIRAGQALVALGAGAALIKGGHLPGAELVDILVTATEVLPFRHPRIETRAAHGTGCTLSAAITAGLAAGLPLPRAVSTAQRYLQAAILAAPPLGQGFGPLWHGVSVSD